MVNEAETTLVRWLRQTQRVFAFCGAGVSVESGLPTFRGSGGIWEGHSVEEVATPEAFAADPQRVWRFYAQRQETLLRVEPNPAHRVLAEMERHYPEFLLVTQNVDNLHERAGSTRMRKIHGSLMAVRCTRCGTVTSLEHPVSSQAVEAGCLPQGECCGALLRPDVVWFGECLNPQHFRDIEAFFRQPSRPQSGAPVVLIIGTSGMVSGGYGLSTLARAFGARLVEINPESSGFSSEVDLLLREPAGELLARIWPQVIANS